MEGGGAAFNNPSTGKIDQQLKILEDLKRQQKLLKSGAAPNLAMNTIPSLPAQQVGRYYIYVLGTTPTIE